MDFKLNEDRRLLSETLMRFLSDKYDIETRHGIVLSDDHYSKDMWAKFAELGIIGALFSEDNGGFGGEGDDLMVVFEALGRHLVVEPFLPTLLAGSILSSTNKDGSNAQLIEAVIEGSTLIALAHGEPASRYELSHVETSATNNGDGSWNLSGDKSVVLGGNAADKLVVSARTSGDTNAEEGISLFLVDASETGVTRRDYTTLDGYGAAEINFNNAKAELLGGEGTAYPLIEEAVGRGITAICAESFGAMEVAKDLTVEYMHTRKQFGVPIGSFQALQHRMADILIELEQMRSALINAVGNLDTERAQREREISACKHLCGTIGRLVAEESIQIHGGMGMTWEYPVGHFAKHIVMIDHVLGDTDHHLERYISFSQTQQEQ